MEFNSAFIGLTVRHNRRLSIRADAQLFNIDKQTV